MAGQYLVVIQLPTPGGELREQALERLNGIARHCLENEPGTLKYAFFGARDSQDDTIWVIEEYTDKASIESHSQSKSVVAIYQWAAEVSFFPKGTVPIKATLGYIPGNSFSKPFIAEAADPLIIYSETDYAAGGTSTGTAQWASVVASSKDEAGTLTYGLLKDEKDENRLCAFEVFESSEFHRDVHCQSQVVNECLRRTAHLQKGVKHHFLKKLGGYLHK